MEVGRRRFGSSDLEISEIGFGCGGYWGFTVFPESQAEKLISLAIEHGVNFFDTGPNYSGGNAEVRLGRILRGRWNGLVVATKVGSRLSPRGKLIRDFSPAGIQSSVEASLSRLGTDHIHLLQLHSPGLSVLRNEETIRALLSLKEKGTISFVGLSAGGDVAEEAIRMGVFDSLMTTYNVTKFYTESTMKNAVEAGMAVLVRAPMAGAVYSPSFYRVRSLSQVWYFLRAVKNFPDDIKKGRRLRFMNKIDGWKATQVALKFTLMSPYVCSAVIGTTKPAHLLDDLAVSSLPPLPGELFEKIKCAAA